MPILFRLPVSLLSRALFSPQSLLQSFPIFFRLGNDGKLQLTNQIITVPARIGGLVLGVFVLRWLLHKGIRPFARQPRSGAVAGVLAESQRGSHLLGQNPMDARRSP